ncbi:MAG: glycosyltransferase [Bacillus cereus]|jgi:glycosyltransferase involved in cell wall biosynthesis|nr:glycosyltransferase [Bacillus cereus]
MAELTIIITFLNEGIELFNTLRSFKDSTNFPFNIILVNDGSTDGFDYKQVADEFGAFYIEHGERKGPAISRNEGVFACSTKYFLLLDAHMRVYQTDWISRVIEELEERADVLLCCSTLDLNKNGEINVESPIGYGASINLSDLSVNWIHGKEDKEGDSIEVPCVLGASYACSKKYWTKLHGLNGLCAYGFEEQLISIKTWLSGGKCNVLKDVKIGHIFREGSITPFEIPVMAYYLNQLLIVELFYNNDYKRIFMKNMRKKIGTEQTNDWIEEFKQYRGVIAKEKEYYKTIFILDFDFIINLNAS